MVLRGDVALSCEQTGARNVRTTVTELHFECIGASGSCKKLVTQANTEYGSPGLVHGILDVFDCALHHGRVTRTVRDEESIVLLASKQREVVVPRYLEDLDASPDQASQLVVFETHVDCDYAHCAAGGMFEGSGRVRGPELRLLDGNYSTVRRNCAAR